MSARRVSVITYAALDAVVLALGLAGVAAVAQPDGSIQGTVTDSSGSSILGAVVTAEGADGNSRTTVTDPAGAFQIWSSPQQVAAGSGPHRVALQNITLRAGCAINVPLRPNQVRGDGVRVPYKELNGAGKLELTLFVAANVHFPESE